MFAQPADGGQGDTVKGRDEGWLRHLRDGGNCLNGALSGGADVLGELRGANSTEWLNGQPQAHGI